MTSWFANSISLQIFRVNPFAVVSHAGSLVPCQNFPSFLLCFNEISTLGISYFLSKIVLSLADTLYGEDTTAKTILFQLHFMGEFEYLEVRV